MANNVMIVGLKALNLCASAYIVIKLSTVLAIGIMFLIVSYAGVEDVGLSNLLAGALIILPLLIVVGGTLIVCAVAAYLNLKAPYRKKALFFSLLLGSISAVGLLLPYTREFALSTALASALALGSALGIFALSKRRVQAL
ncbi:TPA: hypothetical protein I8374_001731 [Serratia marcescens]|jgi:hypothetical protein|uniref:hypothetical protein n=1 Tax=Serratia TaxID=613 RepID=UPI0018D5D4B2|nr:hypothetical protein [Serratia sp. (in: enterobacteria)]MBH2667828.1 hypothetical protein [Serratia marcescens]MBH2672770.1 hypothetical protein [Serratia marcescens]MBH3301501.1 hypothetical protein [Serratia marcescens]HAT2867306.1 hypothetical protein [Serratia marcescens]HAT2872538.1 hypothetical protein [Serratia marcescens]